MNGVVITTGPELTDVERSRSLDQLARMGWKIIWHKQGSGKSLTMVFLVRKMRSSPDLRRRS